MFCCGVWIINLVVASVVLMIDAFRAVVFRMKKDKQASGRERGRNDDATNQTYASDVHNADTDS